MDKDAQKDFTYRMSQDEYFRYKKNWWISLNKSGKIGPMRDRSDLTGGRCEHHTSHVTFSHWFTRTRVAQVVCLSCAHHVSWVISMRSCVCSDSLRQLHIPLSADHLLSYHPVLLPAHQLHLPGCGGQMPCALSLMRTLALLPSTTLSQSVWIATCSCETSRKLPCSRTREEDRESSSSRSTSSRLAAK